MEIQQIHSKQTSTKNLSDCQCDAVILAGIVAAIAFIDAEGDTSKIGMITSLLALQPLWPVSYGYEHQTGATRLEESSMMCSETYNIRNTLFRTQNQYFNKSVITFRIGPSKTGVKPC